MIINAPSIGLVQFRSAVHRGDAASALELYRGDLLERAHAEQSVMIGYLRVDPRLDSLRDAARFRSLLQKAALDF